MSKRSPGVDLVEVRAACHLAPSPTDPIRPNRFAAPQRVEACQLCGGPPGGKVAEKREAGSSVKDGLAASSSSLRGDLSLLVRSAVSER